MKVRVNERNPALCSRKGRFGIIHGQRLFRGPAQLEIVPVRSKWLRLAGRIVGDHLNGGEAKPGASPQFGDMRPIEAPAQLVPLFAGNAPFVDGDVLPVQLRTDQRHDQQWNGAEAENGEICDKSHSDHQQG